MSIHVEPRTGRTVIRVRGPEGRNYTITVNEKNLRRFGIPCTGEMNNTHLVALQEAVMERYGRSAFLSKNRKQMTWLSVAVKQFVKIRGEGTRASYVSECFLKVVGEVLVSDLTREEVDKFQKVLCDRVEDCTLSPASMYSYMRDLLFFCKWLRDSGYIAGNPAENIQLKRYRQIPDYLAEDEIALLVKAVHGTPLEGSVLYVLNTGVRRGEIPRLRWEHIDWSNARIWVDGTKTNAAQRAVPLFEEFDCYLKQARKRKGVVFKNADGNPWTSDALGSALQVLKARVRVAFKWDFKKLRRTYGATLLLAGFPLATVSRLLGHSSVTITERWYVQLTRADVLKTMPHGYRGISEKGE